MSTRPALVEAGVTNVVAPASTLRRNARSGPWWLSLSALAVVALVVVPLAVLVWQAITLSTSTSLRTEILVELTAQTLALAAAVTITAAAIGTFLAYAVHARRVHAPQTVFVLAVLPLAIPTYVGAWALIAVFAPGGVLAESAGALGLAWPFGRPGGFVGSWLLLSVLTQPYVLLAVSAALRRLDPAIVDAARTLGLTRRQTFWRVILPALRPAVAAGSLLVALYVVSDFGAVSLLRQRTLTRAVFVRLGAFDPGGVALLSVILMLLGLALVILERRARPQAAAVRSTSSIVARATRTRDAATSIPRTMVAWLIIALALGPTIIAILRWLPDAPLGLVAQTQAELRTTLRLSAIAAIVVTVAAMPIALWSARYRSRMAAAAEATAFVGNGLPGIVVAIALIVVGTRLLPLVHRTDAMLVFAYVVLFLPLALAAQRTTLMQITPHVEEVARTLGARPSRVVRRVVAPLAARGVSAGAAMVFLTVAKELPATLLLAPAGTSTLATRVWSTTEEALFGAAALPALVLVLIGVLPVLVASSRQR